ncbi:hypothetical protein ADK64_41445 [Streptomyces sp. MMG1121]|nr:hypothetical protein ADK64_41445 [Streptomyces sp. MMG1121]
MTPAAPAQAVGGAGAEQSSSLPGLAPWGRTGVVQAEQTGTARVTQADAATDGRATGQWQQPQWVAPVAPAAPSAAPVGDLGPGDIGPFPSRTIPAPVTDIGSHVYSADASPTDTGSPAHPSGTPLTETGSPAYPTSTPLTDTGSPAHTTSTPPTDTGSFSPLGSATAVTEDPLLPLGTTPATTDTGAFAVPAPPPPSWTPGASRGLRAAKAIAFARAQIGKPCVWGATGPDSYDCSSLTQAAWKAAGVTVPRAAHEQALAGAPVTLAGAEPGDLVLFFDDDRHVGLHVGGGMMVHAPGPGSTIREESIYGAGESAIHRIVRPA